MISDHPLSLPRPSLVPPTSPACVAWLNLVWGKCAQEHFLFLRLDPHHLPCSCHVASFLVLNHISMGTTKMLDGSSFGLTVLPPSEMAKLKAFQRSRESTQSPIFLGRFCSENWFQSWADLERAEEHDCALPIPDGLSVPRGGILSGGAVRCILRRGPGLWSDRGISRGSTQARVGQ